MGKAIPDAVLDLSPDDIALCTEMYICSSEPATRAAAIAASLADVALTGSDFTVADGDTSGRKVTVAAQNAVPVDAAGTANHIALCTASVLRHVTTCTSVALTTPGTIDVPAYKVEFRDPV